MVWSVSTSLLVATTKEESYKSQRAFLLVGWWLLLVGWLLLLPFRAFSSACTSLQWNYPLNSSFTLSYYLANISVCYSTPRTAVSLILSTNEIYPSMLEKSDPIIFTDIVSPSPKMSHYAPPPAEGMGSNRSNTIRLIPCILKSSVSIYLIHHQLILAQLEEWEGDLQNALHSQMSERIESSSRNVFF